MTYYTFKDEYFIDYQLTIKVNNKLFKILTRKYEHGINSRFNQISL